MQYQAHIVQVGFPFAVRNDGRLVPKPELVYAIRTFCYRKKRLSVITLYPSHHQVFAIEFYCTRVKRCIDADPFH